MWRLYFQLSPEGKKRYFQEILPLLHDTKAAVLGDRDDDAWYLVYLGTKPNSQGRGYAARLLQDMMARVSNALSKAFVCCPADERHP
jgi:ribosomal protein S18 acetylase RimI-like enzyme